MTKTFHILVSVMVALPLGAGGLCCCLLGDSPAPMSAVASVPAPPPAHSCCSGPAEPAAAAPDDAAAPDTAGGHKCGCPERETALLAAVAGQEPVAAGTAFPTALLAPVALPAAPVTETAAAFPARPDPPPKRPLFRTLSVLLC